MRFRINNLKPRYPSHARSHTLPTGELSVYCWCGHAIVYVHPRVVLQCQTASCGRPDCQPPDDDLTAA